MESNRIGSQWVALTLAAALLIALTFGLRAVLGMFLSPLNTSTGLGFAAISFALAISQLVAGVAQPLCGAAADRYGPGRVVFTGALLLAASLALMPWAGSVAALTLVFCLLAGASTAVGSTPTLLAAVNRHVPQPRRGLATGVVTAGSSVGQLVLAPVTQASIAATGWVATVYALAVLPLAMLPLSRRLGGTTRDNPTAATSAAPPVQAPSARAALRRAFADPSYWLITGGFFACGFHVSFLLAHMPGVIELCGLPGGLTGLWIAVLALCNIAGSVASGMAIERYALKHMLMTIYSLRALGVLLFIAAPKTEFALIAFALFMGLTYMATVPPTSGLISRRYGAANMGSVFGCTMFIHQIGSFLGVWLGGLVLDHTGSFDWLWRADVALAVLAALVHLPLREARPTPAPVMNGPYAAERA